MNCNVIKSQEVVWTAKLPRMRTECTPVFSDNNWNVLTSASYTMHSPGGYARAKNDLIVVTPVTQGT